MRSEHSDYGADSTPTGLKALTDELDAVIERYRRTHRRPTGPTENMAVILHAFPRTGSR